MQCPGIVELWNCTLWLPEFPWDSPVYQLVSNNFIDISDGVSDTKIGS